MAFATDQFLVGRVAPSLVLVEVEVVWAVHTGLLLHCLHNEAAVVVGGLQHCLHN